MSLHLSTFIKFALTPPVPLLPSFEQASRPDYTFEVAGLQISGHNPGSALGGISYLTVQRAPDAGATPSISEPGPGVLFVAGLAVIVFMLARRKAL